jgi:hypothetical protein
MLHNGHTPQAELIDAELCDAEKITDTEYAAILGGGALPKFVERICESYQVDPSLVHHITPRMKPSAKSQGGYAHARDSPPGKMLTRLLAAFHDYLACMVWAQPCKMAYPRDARYPYIRASVLLAKLVFLMLLYTDEKCVFRHEDFEDELAPILAAFDRRTNARLSKALMDSNTVKSCLSPFFRFSLVYGQVAWCNTIRHLVVNFSENLVREKKKPGSGFSRALVSQWLAGDNVDVEPLYLEGTEELPPGKIPIEKIRIEKLPRGKLKNPKRRPQTVDVTATPPDVFPNTRCISWSPEVSPVPCKLPSPDRLELPSPDPLELPSPEPFLFRAI